MCRSLLVFVFNISLSLNLSLSLWSTQTRQISIEITIGNLLSLEPTNEELLEEKLTMSRLLLLEYVLSKMKNETITYAKLTKHTQDKTGDTLRTNLSTLLSEPETPNNLNEIQNTLQAHEENIIHNLLSKQADYNLLEGERPTKNFLNMENAKQGYSEITRLRIPNTLHNKNLAETSDNLKFINITDSTLIQHEMHTSFQKI